MIDTRDISAERIVIGVDGITVDGHLLPALKLGKDVTVQRSGRPSDTRAAVTLTLYADEAKVTPEARHHPHTNITEAEYPDLAN